MINIGDILARRRHLNGHKEALVEAFSGRRLSFTELDESVNRCANMLIGLGLEKGDRVGFVLRNGLECLQIFLACAKSGLVVVPINWRLVADEIDYIVRDAQISALVYESKFTDTIDALTREDCPVEHWLITEFPQTGDLIDFNNSCAKCSPVWGDYGAADSDLLMIMYTSGTTGHPKGVMHSHYSLYHALLGNLTTLDLRFDDRYLLTMPLFHIGAVTPALTNIYKGITIVIEREFDPARAWELVDHEKITWTLLVPAMLLAMRDCLDTDTTNISSLRLVISGAAPVPTELIRIYEKLGIDIAQAYGLTESGALGCVLSPEDAIRKAGSTGKPQFHSDVRIVDSAGNECAPGERGEVCIRGEHIMVGYWNLPEQTEEALADGGWLRTGDIGIMDKDGYVSIVDRLKDMLISGGENIYPAELEDVLLGIPEIAEAAVVGAVSPKWGESPVAFVVRRDESVCEDHVITHCAAKLAPFKRIARVIFIEQLPRNPSGKVLKNELRELTRDITLP